MLVRESQSLSSAPRPSVFQRLVATAWGAMSATLEPDGYNILDTPGPLYSSLMILDAHFAPTGAQSTRVTAAAAAVSINVENGK